MLLWLTEYLANFISGSSDMENTTASVVAACSIQFQHGATKVSP